MSRKHTISGMGIQRTEHSHNIENQKIFMQNA